VELISVELEAQMRGAGGRDGLQGVRRGCVTFYRTVPRGRRSGWRRVVGDDGGTLQVVSFGSGKK
jgi:hypothetical protein